MSGVREEMVTAEREQELVAGVCWLWGQVEARSKDQKGKNWHVGPQAGSLALSFSPDRLIQNTGL